MPLFGYAITALGLFLLFLGYVAVGCIIFTLGGWLAKKLYPSIRSAGVVIFVTSLSYIFHYPFSFIVLVLILAGLIMAGFKNRRMRNSYDSSICIDEGWGIDIDLSAQNLGIGGDGSSSSDGGGGSGDGGGGGGD